MHDSAMSPREAFEEAHRRAGGHSALARICGCTPPNIAQLVDKGSLLPAEYVLKVEAATGVSRHILRPDIYPLDPPAASAGSAHPGPGRVTQSAPAGSAPPTGADPLQGMVA